MSTALADVCTITMGQAPSGDSYNDRANGIPLIAGAGDFDGDLVSPSKYTTQPCKVCYPGDIILSIRASIGAKVVADDAYCLGRGVAGLRPGPRIDSRYLWHWLSHSERALASKGRGATFVQVNRTDIGELPIDLPDLNDQRRVAAILDRVDAVSAKRRQVLGLLETLPGAFFQHMVRDRGFATRPLGEVATFVRGVTFKPTDKVDAGVNSVAVMRTKNVQRLLDRSDEIHIPSRRVRRPEQYLRLRDTLISSANSWNLVGRACLVDEVESPAVIGGFVTALRSQGEVDPTYLFHWFTSATVQATVRSFSSQTTNIANLSLKRCADLEIPIPPPDVQRDFADRVAVVDRQRDTVRCALASDDELFASLQARAFRGEL